MHVSNPALTLQYNVAGVTHFCFNIEAAHTPMQRIVSESVMVSPQIALHQYADATHGNRFIRFDAQAGPLQVQYQASVELQPLQSVEGLQEVPVSQVPDDVLHYMMPSRYCESDVMSRSAQQMERAGDCSHRLTLAVGGPCRRPRPYFVRPSAFIASCTAGRAATRAR